MRKIESNFFISLDGVVESPDKWHFPYFDDEMGAAIGAGAANVSAYLMGRVLLSVALDLVESRAFATGIALQIYRPDGRPQYAE